MSDETIEQVPNLPQMPADVEKKFQIRQEYMDTIVSHAHKTFNTPEEGKEMTEATGLVVILFTEDGLGATVQLGSNIKDDKIIYVLESVLDRMKQNG